MTNYRRSRIAGASYFFTVNLADRSQTLLTGHIDLSRSVFEYTLIFPRFSVFQAVGFMLSVFSVAGR